MFTIGNIVAIIVFVAFGLAISIGIAALADEHKRTVFVSGIVATFVLCVFIFGGVAWYNTHTASGLRALKDNKSELSNGILREIKITAEDGREIFYYKGKIDVESDHVDNYIKFESEEGLRKIIYYGITDTVLIEEVTE